MVRSVTRGRSSVQASDLHVDASTPPPHSRRAEATRASTWGSVDDGVGVTVLEDEVAEVAVGHLAGAMSTTSKSKSNGRRPSRDGTSSTRRGPPSQSSPISVARRTASGSFAECSVDTAYTSRSETVRTSEYRREASCLLDRHVPVCAQVARPGRIVSLVQAASPLHPQA